MFGHITYRRYIKYHIELQTKSFYWIQWFNQCFQVKTWLKLTNLKLLYRIRIKILNFCSMRFVRMLVFSNKIIKIGQPCKAWEFSLYSIFFSEKSGCVHTPNKKKINLKKKLLANAGAKQHWIRVQNCISNPPLQRQIPKYATARGLLTMQTTIFLLHTEPNVLLHVYMTIIQLRSLNNYEFHAGAMYLV